ncbi:hypothetical protein HHK36_016327 [Tetracentron sinense]|uniref:SHSP domain-containing protein n=1 Tax=Tetracentron sinense TaxID=13715 RepID=A0A835DBU8_TETSI|nr:hypothetical protein HHK36_016327 [Tetracentron sinense]
MSIIPSIFGGRRSNVYDPFSLDIWDPFQEIPFSTALSTPRPEVSEETAKFVTRIDWKETPEAHIFKADLPGLKKEEVNVEVEEALVISSADSGCLRMPRPWKTPKEEVKKPDAKPVEISG